MGAGVVDPVELVQELATEFDLIAILDLGGIASKRKGLDLIGKLVEAGPAWVHAGTRLSDGIIDLLVAGAEEVVVFPNFLLRGFGEWKDAFELSENIVIGLDLNNWREKSLDEHIFSMGLSGFLEAVHGLGATKVLITRGEGPLPSDINHVISGRDFELYTYRWKNLHSDKEVKGVLQDVTELVGES